MRRKSILLSLVALFSGLATSIGISRILEGPPQKPAEITQESILVAAADIDVGEPVGFQNVKLVESPANRIPADCIRDCRHLKSTFAGRRLKMGEPIVRADLESSPAESSPAANLPAENAQAASSPPQREAEQELPHPRIRLQVTVAAAEADFIQPGDRVQLVVVNDTAEHQQQVSQLVLDLAHLHSIDREVGPVVIQHGSRLISQQVSLVVQEADVSLVLLAQEVGRLHMANSHVPETSDPEITAACTMADLVAFAVQQNRQEIASPVEIPEAKETAAPSIPVQPIPPVVTPPVVKDVNTLGRTGRINSSRRQQADVVTPAEAKALASPAREGLEVQVRVSDKLASPATKTTPRVEQESLRQ